VPKLVHIGFGNFHRAHQAWYTQIANRSAGEDWSITGVAMRNPAVRDAMAADRAYDLGIMHADGLQVERIALHDEVIVAAETPMRVIEAIADPSVQAITVTITEKGYHLTPDGILDTADPDIASDVSGATMRTALGLLAKGLCHRRQQRAGPIAVLSCDNLSGNGTFLLRALEAFLAASGAAPDTLDGIRFPNTMVDRITPATSADIADRIAKAAGRPVTAPVLTEAFSEWVIEETDLPLPGWTRGGAVFVPDVGPYERRKLLLLNAAHSALAYGGLLRGHAHVHEAVADPLLAQHIRNLWAEAAFCLPEFSRAELNTYTAALLDRFSVSGMAHRLSQIAMDGSQKLPQRLVPILRSHAFQAPAAQRVLADWWRLLKHQAATGAALDDPMGVELNAAIARGGPEPPRFIQALGCLGLSHTDLPGDFAQRSLESTTRP
jgi:fructuronate reductase